MGVFFSAADALGFTGRGKAIAAWALLVLAILIVLALIGWRVSAYLVDRDARAIEGDRNRRQIESQQKVIAADREAGASKADRDMIDQREAAELKRKADEARRNGRSPLDALADGLR